MANMEILINEFIAAHELDESAKDAVIDLVNSCFTAYVTHMSAQWITSAAPVTKKAAAAAATKKPKVEKCEDPTECETEAELNERCTTAVLDDYCRTHKLRIGGEGGKASRVARVWRHIQGASDEDDYSPRSKPKKAPVKKEPHKCSCKTIKGAPCGCAATNERQGHWFCHKHIDQADDFFASLEAEEEPEPVTPKPSPKAAAPAKPVSKKPSANIKKAVAAFEPELEEEDDA
jgi:hypothetical protein